MTYPSDMRAPSPFRLPLLGAAAAGLLWAVACTSSGTAADGGLDGGTPPEGGTPSEGAGGPPVTNPDLDPPANCPTNPPSLKLTLVAEGLGYPVFVTSPPADDRLFVVLQTGEIRIVKDGVLLPEPYLTESRALAPTAIGHEYGLLGLAFDPSFAQTRRLFVAYTANSPYRYEIAEYMQSTAAPDRAEGGTVRFSTPRPARNHNGGWLGFDGDGRLFASTGDSGSANDPDDLAQDLSSPLGKMLRFDIADFPSPPDGNLLHEGTRTAAWSYGLRNVWRASFDRKTGDLYMGDVGQGAREEINFEPRGVGGRNYGWKIMEGDMCRPGGPADCNKDGLTLPVAVHPREEAKSITGGYVYRGRAIPCLRGRYIYGDYVTKRFFSFVMEGGTAVRSVELTADLTEGGSVDVAPASFGEDRRGEMYVSTLSGGGRVYRIDAE